MVKSRMCKERWEYVEVVGGGSEVCYVMRFYLYVTFRCIHKINWISN